MRVTGTEDMRVGEVFAFIKERHSVFLKKEAGEPKPWTTDPILQRYRFCTAYRENDRVTRWVEANWRTPHATDPDLWFAMVVARHLNLPDSLAELGYPVPWDRDHFIATLAARKTRKERNFNAAYMIGTHGNAIEKAVYLADHIFTPLWEQREMLRPKPRDTLTSYHIILGQFMGLGNFLTAQVIADLKQVEPLRSATDWATFAASGPGSRRGLNRVIGRHPNAPWREDEWRMTLTRLREALLPFYDAAGMPRPCAQDVQNIACCEWDKLERARLGEGRPKQLYPGA